MRAARLEMVKEPKPTRAMRSPFFNDFSIAPTVAFRARSESALLNFVSVEMASTNSALFMCFVF